MPRKKQQKMEEGRHPNGLREGVLNDQEGVQFGITMDNKTVNPQEIAEIRETSLNKKSSNDKR